MSTVLTDKYQKHKGRVLAAPWFVLLNGLKRGTTTPEMAESHRANVVAAWDQLCEEDAKLRDPDDPRVRKYGYLRNQQEDRHIALGLRAVESWTKGDSYAGTAARVLADTGGFMRVGLRKAMALMPRPESRYSIDNELTLDLELPPEAGTTLPDFLRGV